MIEQARGYCPGLANVRWEVTNGFDVASIGDGALDFSFSFLVFQHVPQKEIVLRNVAEMLRALRPGGGFLFQYNGQIERKTGWREKVIWGILDRWRVPLLPVSLESTHGKRGRRGTAHRLMARKFRSGLKNRVDGWWG